MSTGHILFWAGVALTSVAFLCLTAGEAALAHRKKTIKRQIEREYR